LPGEINEQYLSHFADPSNERPSSKVGPVCDDDDDDDDMMMG
jgi:hypothetical protein